MSLPTAQELEMLQLINRFRADPAGEAGRITGGAGMAEQEYGAVLLALGGFHVDQALFAQQMAALTAAAPLAWNTTLESAAAAHSALMISGNAQSHQLPGELGLGARISAAGYSYQTVGENIFAFASSPNQSHAAFVVDWGGGTGGMQTPPGHRNNLINANYVEIGIDITVDSDPNNSVGPLVITQDIGKPFGYSAQFLGAVFADADKDGFYDAGEGKAGITVTASGLAGTFATTTWDSGGWQMAVPAGSYTVSFSDPTLGSYSTAATMGSDNVQINALAAQFAAALPAASIGADRTVSESQVVQVFTVTLDRPATSTASVQWALGDGTAKQADGDFPAGQGGTLTFAAGDSKASFAVVLNDQANRQEGTEDFTVVLTQPSGIGVARASATVTVLDDYVAPPAVPLAMTNSTTKTASTPAMTAYAGPVGYLDQQFVYLGTDAIVLAANAPNVFLRSGSGDDALLVTAGQNVLDAGTGSNFLTGGAGPDTFFLDGRDPPFAVWDTVVGLSAGDAVTLWGVTAASYNIGWFENQGAAGFKGLTMHANAPGKINVSLTLAGLTDADRTGGRLTVLFGNDPGSGSDYMYIYANS